MGAKSQLRRDKNFAKCQTDFERLLSHALGSLTNQILNKQSKFRRPL